MATNDNAFQDIDMKGVGQQLQYPLDYVTQEILKQFVNGAYPVGSVYINTTNSANPSTYLGVGVWTAIQGYVIAGYKSGDANFGTAGATVGAATHTLSLAEIPSHSHPNSKYQNIGGNANSGFVAGGNVETADTGLAGGGGSHNNIQPTLVAYVWKRTA